MKVCRIHLYAMGKEQSWGYVSVSPFGKTKMGDWFLGGSHVMRRPLGLIRRIALDWLHDGGDRNYFGRDDKTGTTYEVRVKSL